MPIVSARPTITLNGWSAPALADDMVVASVEEDVFGLARCRLALGVQDPTAASSYLSGGPLGFGDQLTVAFPDGAEPMPVFTGRIVAIGAAYSASGRPVASIMAADRLIDLGMTRRSRVFEEMAAAEVAQEIAQQHGMGFTANGTLGGGTRTWAQLNQSDLGFLRDLAAAVDADIALDGDALALTPAADRPDSQVALTRGAGLSEYRVSAELEHQRSSLGVAGWSLPGGHPFGATATTATRRACRPVSRAGRVSCTARSGRGRRSMRISCRSIPRRRKAARSRPSPGSRGAS